MEGGVPPPSGPESWAKTGAKNAPVIPLPMRFLVVFPPVLRPIRQKTPPYGPFLLKTTMTGPSLDEKSVRHENVFWANGGLRAGVFYPPWRKKRLGPGPKQYVFWRTPVRAGRFFKEAPKTRGQKAKNVDFVGQS